ncbi:hypothetical protein ACHHYP_03085 [Achlya hypogyna]|uniref:Uncharacterized protein n=1 Tax=Achlya hypogyna TaxID=1202772 RepID=A0A1V9Z4L3_ACHHY|nr:hypothetical protein ACHHYP_03085 [Achlya hypogyna]
MRNDPLAQYLGIVPEATEQRTTVLDHKQPTQPQRCMPRRPASARPARARPSESGRVRAFQAHIRRRFDAFVASDKTHAHNLFVGFPRATEPPAPPPVAREVGPDPHWKTFVLHTRSTGPSNQLDDPTFALNTNPSEPLVDFAPKSRPSTAVGPELPSVARLAQQLDERLENEVVPSAPVLTANTAAPRRSCKSAQMLAARVMRRASAKPSHQYVEEYAKEVQQVQMNIRRRVRAHMEALLAAQANQHSVRAQQPVDVDQVLTDLAQWRLHDHRFDLPPLFDVQSRPALDDDLTITIECSLTTKDEGAIAFSLPSATTERFHRLDS